MPIDEQLLAGASGIRHTEDFKRWTREVIRPILPHGTLACGLGHIHAGGVGLDNIVVVDYPLEHLNAIRNKAGAIDTPILRRWLATREPQLFEPDCTWPEISAEWLVHFRANDLRNAAAHACYDAVRCIGTYFSFHRIPDRLHDGHRAALERVVPVMHEVLHRVIAGINHSDDFETRLSELTERERQIVQWLRYGKTNSAIADIVGLSETTVKHHLTRVFGKLGVENRAQCVRRQTESEARRSPGNGTRLL